MVPTLPQESTFTTTEAKKGGGRVVHHWVWRDALVQLQGGLTLEQRQVGRSAWLSPQSSMCAVCVPLSLPSLLAWSLRYGC